MQQVSGVSPTTTNNSQNKGVKFAQVKAAAAQEKPVTVADFAQIKKGAHEYSKTLLGGNADTNVTEGGITSKGNNVSSYSYYIMATKHDDSAIIVEEIDFSPREKDGRVCVTIRHTMTLNESEVLWDQSKTTTVIKKGSIYPDGSFVQEGDTITIEGAVERRKSSDAALAN